MKLKYYLRGLGMGILMTAIITGVSTKSTSTMTDEQIRAEARKLGMVEGNTVLSESDGAIESDEAGKDESEQKEESSGEEEEESQSEADVITQNSTKQDEADAITEESEMGEVQNVSGNTATQENDEAEENILEEKEDADETADVNTLDEVETEAPENKETESEPPKSAANVQTIPEEVNIVVNKGESSMIISTKLEAAGVVTNAVDFDKYLCAHGYDKILHTGRHTIRIGASYDEIARILMTKP